MVKTTGAKSKAEYLAMAEQCEQRAIEHPEEATVYLGRAQIWRQLAGARKEETTHENHFTRKSLRS